MKNILKHSNGSQTLLSNVDDGTNRIFINDVEIDSSKWVGSGTYTQVIDNVTISIAKISDLSGNIMLQKVSANTYRLVRKESTSEIPFSHVGQIIESTTLDTLAKVQAIYGSDTTWIQHSGYILRGATSGVTENSATKDGGEDTHKLTVNEMPSHTHIQNSHVHAVPGYHYSSTYSAYNRLELQTDGNLVLYNSADGSAKWSAGTSTSAGARRARATGIGHNDDGNNTTSATATNQNTGGGAAHNIMQSYKNVYIWERTA